MQHDEDFEPLLGKLRAPPSRAGRRYLNQVIAASQRLGAARTGRSKFDGSRIGRGAAIGRVLGAADRFAALRSRRAIVKTRLVRLRRTALGALRAHLKYIERDGVQRDGSRGTLYGASDDPVDARPFIGRCAGDRHQFRLILSAEDSDQYDDLRPLVRRFMAQMEQDLGTRLDWVAADHFDTGRPHSHLVIRGKDENGKNLVIAREYIARGMRARLAELVSIDLGPRQDHEIVRRLHRDVDAERVTSIDRSLLRDSGETGCVSATHRDPLWHALRTGRLRKLELLGLAENLGAGRWVLAPDLQSQLRALGERGDIVRTMQRSLKAAGIERAPAEMVLERGGLHSGVVIGRLVDRGLSDELSDKHFLIIDGIDGHAHHIELPSGETIEALPENSVLRLTSRQPEIRTADRTIHAVARANDGKYGELLHRIHDPSAGNAFITCPCPQARGSSPCRRASRAIGGWRVGRGTRLSCQSRNS